MISRKRWRRRPGASRLSEAARERRLPQQGQAAERNRRSHKTFSVVATNRRLSDKEREVRNLQVQVWPRPISISGSTVAAHGRRKKCRRNRAVAARQSASRIFQKMENQQVLRFREQLYLLTTQWAQEWFQECRRRGIDSTRQKKAGFIRQADHNAICRRICFTNTEYCARTLGLERRTNLVGGMKSVAEDIEGGHGSLRIRQSIPVASSSASTRRPTRAR